MNLLCIKNGRLIDPANQVDKITDIYIQNKKILSLGKAPNNLPIHQTINAEGLIVCPGLIDTSARLGESGNEHKATIASETKAAMKGGITTLCCPPDTSPIMDTPAVTTMLYKHAQRIGRSRVLPIGAATKALESQELSNMHSLTKAHCIALSNAKNPIDNALIERRIMEYAKTFDFTLILKPQDSDLADGGCAHEGTVATRLGLTGIPAVAETLALAKSLALITDNHCHVHFEGISTAKSVVLLQQAITQKLPISASVPIHQLHLTEMDLDGFDSNCHVSPPFRTTHDRDTLRQGVASSIITVICSDHHPHESDAKLQPFPSTKAGISGVDTLLSLTLKLVHDKIMPLDKAIACLTIGPAKALNLPYGRLGLNDIADICIFDPHYYAVVSKDSLQSEGKNTPFIGWELPGQVTHTLLKGKLIFERNPEKTS